MWSFVLGAAKEDCYETLPRIVRRRFETIGESLLVPGGNEQTLWYSLQL